VAKQTFDFGGISVRVLAADAFAGDVAGQFVQLQSNGKTLLTGHQAIALDLLFQCRWCRHGENIPRFSDPAKAFNPVVWILDPND
jgi:hypothetical protein